MNNLDLIVTNKTSKGAVHLNLKSDGDDLGILYLSKTQFENILPILRGGCFQKDVDFNIINPYEDIEN